jgi:adenosine deaminase
VTFCRRSFLLLLSAALSFHPFSALAQARRVTSTATDSAEARTARAFDDARQLGSPALRAFLYRMPKGADLHNHLYGAIYAESWIREAE